MENAQPVKQTKICKHCKSEIDKNAKICPHCRKRVAIGLAGKIVAGLFAFFVLMIVIVAASGGSSSPTSSTASSSPSASSGSVVHIGNNGYLRISGDGRIVVPRTKEALDEYTKDAVNKDTYGMAQLVLDGNAFFVDNGTKVLVIDSTWDTIQVRILEGDQTGESGWVPTEFVSAQ